MPMIDEEQQLKRIYGTDNTIGLFVSLYLIILAFFLMLTALSQQVIDRAFDVSEAMQKTFGGSQDKVRERFDKFGSRVDPTDEPILQGVNQWARDEFDTIGRFDTNNGNEYRVELPLGVFFQLGSATLNPEMDDSIERLMDSVTIAKQDKLLEVTLYQGMFAIGDEPAAVRQRALAYRRASALVAGLRSNGFRKRQVQVGEASIGSDQIRLQFRLVDLATPIISLPPLEEAK